MLQSFIWELRRNYTAVSNTRLSSVPSFFLAFLLFPSILNVLLVFLSFVKNLLEFLVFHKFGIFFISFFKTLFQNKTFRVFS